MVAGVRGACRPRWTARGGRRNVRRMRSRILVGAVLCFGACLVAAPTRGQPTCAFGSLDVLFEETFEDTAFAARGWYDGVSAITTAESHGGSSAAEYRFTPGARTPVSGGAMRHLFPGTAAVYLSYWVKYSASYTGSDRPYHPHEFHFVTNENSMWVGPAFTRLTTYVEQNEGTPLLAIQDGENIDPSRVGQDLTAVTEDRAVAGCNGDSDGHGPGDCYLSGGLYRNGKAWRAPIVAFSDAPGPHFKNDWHRVEAFFQLNGIVGGQGVADGHVKYWFDGQPLIALEDVMLRTGAHGGMLFNQFLIAPYIGDGSPVDQTTWVDDLVVATPGVSLLRNDEVRRLSPPMPAVATILGAAGPFALDERGADSCPQAGEGALGPANGSEDDDDHYMASFASGAADPDSGPDPTRPLVFYEVTLATDTLRLRRDAAGLVVLTY